MGPLAPAASPFDPPPQRAGAAVRGGAVAIAGQGVRTGVRLVGTVVLARLLTPADFGLVAMVGVVTGFVGMFTDVGLSAATVQRPRVTHEQVSTLFWLNVGLGCVLAALTAACSPLVAWFYGEPRLAAMTAVSAGGFVLAGFTVQHGAILRRRMRFHTVTAIGMASGVAGTAAGMTLAFTGWGVWSLVVMGLVGSAVGLVLTWAAAAWLPGRPVRRSGVRGMLKFGGTLAGFDFVNYFSRRGDDFLIGWWHGAGPLGLYTRAYSLLLLPVQQINGPASSVVVSTLSRLQHDPAEYRAFFRTALSLTAAAGGLLIAIAFVAADEVVSVLLGPGWGEAVPVFRLLAPAALMATTNAATGWVCVSLGRGGRQLRWGVFASGALVAAIAAGVPWGITGVAVAVSASRVLLRVPCLWYCFRETPVRLRDFWSPAGGPMVACIIAAAAGVWLLPAAMGSAPTHLLAGDGASSELVDDLVGGVVSAVAAAAIYSASLLVIIVATQPKTLRESVAQAGGEIRRRVMVGVAG